ncbi:MBG domain-containing protein [Secundilactobacillus kimchicus]|uniref:MBG domain-containing protein n=1 Tax=Secundilactobacillus kimchicus TaxID=528209 RepID=UPI001C00DB02|nr:MBG domain-containing protein [Secundilactobacillus kimchicus]
MINGKRSKLTMAMAEEKRHYKMYKRGKTWVIVGMSLFFTTAFGAVTMQTAKADTAVTDTAQVGTSSAATTTSDQPADATNSVADSSAAPAASDDQSASSVATDVSSAQAKESSVANDTTAVPAPASSAVAASGNESAQSASDRTQSVAPASFAVSSAEAEKWTPRVARVSYKMAVAASAAQVKSEDDAATSRTTNGTPVKEMTTTFESNGSNVKLKGGQLQIALQIDTGATGVALNAGDKVVLTVDPKGWDYDNTDDGNNANFDISRDKTAGTITLTAKNNVKDLTNTTLTIESRALTTENQSTSETYDVKVNYYNAGTKTPISLTPSNGGLTYVVQPAEKSDPTTVLGSYLSGLSVDAPYQVPKTDNYRRNQLSQASDGTYNFIFEEPVMSGMAVVQVPEKSSDQPDSYQYTVTSDHEFLTDASGNLAYEIHNGGDVVTDTAKESYSIAMASDHKSFTVSVSKPDDFHSALVLTYYVKNPDVQSKVNLTGQLNAIKDDESIKRETADHATFKYLMPANPGYMPVLTTTPIDGIYQDSNLTDGKIIDAGIADAYVNQATGSPINLKSNVTISSIIEESTQQTIPAGNLKAGQTYKVTYRLADPKSGNTVTATGEIKVGTFTTQNVIYHTGDNKPTLLSLVQSGDSFGHQITVNELSGTISDSIFNKSGVYTVPVTYHGETKNATITVIAADAIKTPTGTHVYDGQTTASQVPVIATVDDKTSVALTYGTDYTFVNPDDAKNVNVGTYQVKLTADGKQAIQKAIGNSGINFGDGLGRVTITPATVTITGPKVAKEYDGKPYSGELKATITGLPASGSPVNYTLTDVSGYVNPGTYMIGVNVADGGNPNYRIVTVPGQLTITEKSGPTDSTDPKGPTDPTGPTDPKGPTDPTGPTNPTDPTAPTTPEDPTQPGRQEEQTPLTPEPKPITEKKHETPGKTGQSPRHQQSINQQKLTRHAKLVTAATVKTKAGQSSTPAGTTKAKTLPQTSDGVNQQTTLMGAALLGIISLLGLVGIGRKKRDELK